jgi:hypothetical protein
MLIPTMKDAPDDTIASAMGGNRTGISGAGATLVGEPAG